MFYLDFSKANSTFAVVFQTAVSLPCNLRKLRKTRVGKRLDWKKEGTKIVPANIGEFLTARSLAFWSIDDGCLHSTGYGFYLCTHSFT
jgi:hypothetical protein